MSSPEQPPIYASRSPAEPDRSSARAPAALRLLLVGIGVTLVLLVGLPIYMLVNQSDLVATIERETTGTLSEEWMARVVGFVMIYSIGLHLLDVIVLGWLTPKVLRGRQWARVTLTVCLAIGTAGSLYSAEMGGIFVWVAMITGVLYVFMVVMMWAPPSVRRFFTMHRAVCADTD